MLSSRNLWVCALLLLRFEVPAWAQNFKKFYIVPILTRDCMTNYFDKEIIEVKNVELYRQLPNGQRTKVLEFPGCFHLDITVNITSPPSSNLILFESFKWHQSGNEEAEILDLGCQNPDAYGCGGIGNRWCFTVLVCQYPSRDDKAKTKKECKGRYYCDVCNNIKNINKDLPSGNKLEVECPKTKGIYRLQESHCINDWGKLDKDKDGDPDFLQNEEFEDYKKLLTGLKTAGLGSMSLQAYIATNATQSQQLAMNQHKSVLKQTYPPSMYEAKWAETHKKFWLPKLVTENKEVCVEIFFNICEWRYLTPQQLQDFNCNE